jgi:hypothetical protein
LGNPISQKEAEQLIAPHLPKAELAVWEGRRGFAVAANFQEPFFFRADPQQKQGREFNTTEYSIRLIEENSYFSRALRSQANGTLLELELQMEDNYELTVWIKNSRVQFLPGSAIQANSLVHIEAARERLITSGFAFEVTDLVFGYALPTILFPFRKPPYALAALPAHKTRTQASEPPAS